MAHEPPDDLFVFDSDAHYYEPADAFTRYIDEEYRPRSVRFETGPRNENFVFVDGEPLADFPQWYPPLDRRAGTDDFFGNMVRKDRAAHSQRDDKTRPVKPEYFASIPPPWVSRQARLELLDEQGVHATLLLPSVGVVWQEQARGKPDLICAVTRAFNRWLEDEWGYGADGRIYGVPLIALEDLDQALAELDRVTAAGARVVGLHVGPVGTDSPAAPKFDPLWERIEQHQLLVAFHIGASCYAPVATQLWGEELAPSGRRLEDQGAFMWATSFGDRPIMDMLSSLIYWNLFGRYPGIQIVSIENGADWVEYLLKRLDKMAVLGRRGPWPGGRLEERPSEIFRRHVSVVPFPEENIPRLVSTLGADRVPFGSDYPHPEGLPEPRRMLQRLERLDEPTTRLVMGENALRLLRLTRPSPIPEPSRP